MTASVPELKGAYLYKFAKFITWPATVFTADSDPFSICILGDAPLHSYLASQMQKQKAAGREIHGNHGRRYNQYSVE